MSLSSAKKLLLAGKPMPRFISGAASHNEEPVPRPASVIAGDLLIFALYIFANGSDNTVTPPSGFTLVSLKEAGQWNFRIYKKIATAAEPASYSFAVNPSGSGRAQAMLCYRKARNVVVGEPSPREVRSTVVAPSINASGNGLVAALFGTVSPDAPSSVPSGLAFLAGLTGANSYSIYAYGAKLQAGATGDKVLTTTPQHCSGLQMEILP